MDGEKEVGALGAGVDAGSVLGVKGLENFGDDLLGSGGREGEHGRVAELAAGLADGEEGGAKVVSPLRDAVSFVDDEEGDAAGFL